MHVLKRKPIIKFCAGADANSLAQTCLSFTFPLIVPCINQLILMGLESLFIFFYYKYVCTILVHSYIFLSYFKGVTNMRKLTNV